MLYYCKQNNIGLLIKICKTLTPIFVCKTLEEEMEDKKDIKIEETKNDEAEIAAAPIGSLGDKLKSKIKGSTLKTNFDETNYMVSQEIDTTKIGTKTNQHFSVLDAGQQKDLANGEVVLAIIDQPTQDYNDAYFVKNQEGQYFVYISDELKNKLLKNNSGFEFPQSLETGYNNFSKYPIEKMKLSSSLQLEEIKISGAGTDIAMMFSALGCQVKNAEGKIAKLRCEDHFDITVSTNLLKECFTEGSKCEFDKVEPAYSSTLIALTQLERHKDVVNSKGKETADDVCVKLPNEEKPEVELHSLKIKGTDGKEQYLNLKIEDGKTFAYLQTTNEANKKNYRTARYYEIDSAHLEAATADLSDSMMYIGLREKGSGKGNNVTRVNLDIDFNLNKAFINKMQDILGRKFGEKAEGTENVVPIAKLDIDGRKQNVYNRSLDKFATINALNTVAGLSKTIDESKDFTNPNVPLDKDPENNIPPINDGGDKEGIISGGLNPEQPNPTNPTNPTDPEPPVNPVDPTGPENPENPTNPENPEQPVEPQQPDPEVQNPEQPAPENQAPEKPDDGKDKDKPADKGEKKDEGNKDKKKEKKPWNMKGLHLFNDIFGVSSSTVGILLAIIGGVILNPALYGVGLMLLALSPLSAIAGSVVEAIGELTKGAEKVKKPDSMKKKELERTKDRYRLKDLQNDITMTYSEKYEVAQNRIMHITQKRQELLNRNAEISKNALVSEYDQLSSLETLDDAQKKKLKQLKKDKTVKELLNERTENEKSVKELQQLADDFRSYAYEVRLETMSIPERLKEVQEIKNSLNDYTRNAVGTSELMRNIGKLETPALGAFVKEYNKYETKINDLNTTQQQLNKVFAKEYNIDVEDYKQQVLKSASSLDENGVVSNPAYPKEIVDTIMNTRYFSTDEKCHLINGLKDQNAAEQNKITEEIMQLNDEVFALEENKEFKELSLKRDELLTVAQKSKNQADKTEAMKQVQEIETNPVYAENIAKIEEKNNIINQKQEISDTLSANDKKYTKILTEQAKTLQEIMAESYDICQKLAAANEKPFDVVTTIKSLNKFENADKAVISESVSSFLKDENNKVFDQKIKLCNENPDKYLAMNSVKRLKSTDEYQQARAKFEKDKDLQSNMKLLEFYEQQEKDLIAQLPAEKQAEVAPVEIFKPFERTEIVATNIEETEKEISAEEEALQILQSNNPNLTLEDVGFNLNEGEAEETPATPVEEEKPIETENPVETAEEKPAEVTEETPAQEVEQPVETPVEQPKEEVKEKAEPAQEQEKPIEVVEEKTAEVTEEKAEETPKPSKGKKTAQKEQKPENDAEQLTIEGYENIPVEKPAKKRGRPRKVQKDGELKNITLEEADKQEEAQKEVAPAEKAEEKKEKELPKEEQKTEKEVVDQKGKKGKIEKVSLEEIGETKEEKAAREAREKEEAEKLEMQQILESNTEFERKKSFFGKLTSKSKKAGKSSKSSNSGRGM